MADEKKEERIEEKAAKGQEGAAEVKSETAPAAPQAEPAKEAKEKPKTTLAKKERPSNCAGCNKSIKKKRWYYRNGKYYCTKRCWKNAVKKEKTPKDSEEKK